MVLVIGTLCHTQNGNFVNGIYTVAMLLKHNSISVKPYNHSFFYNMIFFSIYCSLVVVFSLSFFVWVPVANQRVLPMCSFDGWLVFTCFSESFIVSRKQYCVMIADTCSMQTFAEHNSLKQQLVTTTTCVQVHVFFLYFTICTVRHHQHHHHYSTHDCWRRYRCRCIRCWCSRCRRLFARLVLSLLDFHFTSVEFECGFYVRV